MPELKVDAIVNLAGSGKPNLPVAPTVGSNAAISTLNTHSYTSSGTEPSTPKNGALWWDSANDKVMVYIDSEFKEISLNADAGGAIWYGARALFFSGYTTAASANVNTIQYVAPATAGNAADFGDVTVARTDGAACSNGTRAIFGGGYASALSNVIDYVTTATTGNAQDFGDMLETGSGHAALSDGTKGVFAGGYMSTSSNAVVNTIQFVTIDTAGNMADFGDLLATQRRMAGTSDATRGLFAGGEGPSNVIQYITVANAGNATDFGDLTVATQKQSGASDATRSLFMGGETSGRTNTIVYVTTANAGNATDFGDLTEATESGSSTNDDIYAVRGGGGTSGGRTNVIDRVTIQTAGNASDFGDLLAGNQGLRASSGAAS